MSAWRREFIARFPQHQTDAQAANYPGDLMPRPLFFLLKDAIDDGDHETVRKVATYVLWLIQNDEVRSRTALQDDLVGPITDSTRCSGFIQVLEPEERAVVAEYCVVDWWSESRKERKLRNLGLR